MIKVFDNCLTDREKELILNTVQKPRWSFGHKSVKEDPDGNLFWVLKLFQDKDTFYSEHMLNRIQEITGDRLECTNAYFNGHTACSTGDVHIDSDHENARTFLIYGPSNWEEGMGGHTDFYNEDKEVIKSIQPRPFRCVYFKSNIPHGATPLSKDFKELRTTLAFKLTVKD